MNDTATLKIDGKEYTFPIINGSEGERAIDISTLRKRTGLITLDPGYVNTGSCTSDITYIDGEKGILRYRGIPIEQLARYSSFRDPRSACLILSTTLGDINSRPIITLLPSSLKRRFGS